MRKYKIASVLMLIQGGLMEIGGCLCLIPALIFSNQFNPNQYFSFVVPYFSENLHLVLVAGFIYGIIRIVGAVGLWKNRLWGLALSMINCVLSLGLMMFMLPVGIMDGILAGSALVLILAQYFGNQKIIR